MQTSSNGAFSYRCSSANGGDSTGASKWSMTTIVVLENTKGEAKACFFISLEETF